jgi:hypothetical protein
MAEMLVRVVDKVGVDLYKDCQCTKRGDVIVAQADGWNWGLQEKTNPHYRIIKVPGLTVSAAQALCSPEVAVDPNNPSRTLQKRGFKLDLANVAWPAGFQAWLSDSTRATPVFTAVFGNVISAMALLKILKPPVVDPNVIGNPANVIG